MFRKGGEEFVVLLSGVAGEAATQAGERLRAAVEAMHVLHAGSAVAPVLSVTIGLASTTAGAARPRLLKAAADQAMSAKVAGRRNRVHAVQVAADDA